MGTRADFYIGMAPNIKYLGSLPYDGYPLMGNGHGIPKSALMAKTEQEFRTAIMAHDGKRFMTDWPWPWENSTTTDWSYTLHEGEVYISSWGRPWVKASEYLALDDCEETDIFCNGEQMNDWPLMRKSNVLWRKGECLDS